MDEPPEVTDLKAWADNKLLNVMGAPAYMEACALMRELEDLVADMEPIKAAEALSTFNTLVALRYAERRRNG
jgi:hypothetical protein